MQVTSKNHHCLQFFCNQYSVNLHSSSIFIYLVWWNSLPLCFFHICIHWRHFQLQSMLIDIEKCCALRLLPNLITPCQLSCLRVDLWHPVTRLYFVFLISNGWSFVSIQWIEFDVYLLCSVTCSAVTCSALWRLKATLVGRHIHVTDEATVLLLRHNDVRWLSRLPVHITWAQRCTVA